MSSYFDSLVNVYVSNERISKLKNISLSQDELERLYRPYTRLGQILENNIGFLVAQDRFYDHLTSLNELIQEPWLGASTNFFRIIANDLLIFSSVYPSIFLKYNEFHKSQIEYEGELRRFSLRALAPSVSAAAAADICTYLRQHLNDNMQFDGSKSINSTILSHVVPDEYLRLREDPSQLPQVLMTLSLCNYVSSFKEEIIADPLCQSIMKSDLCLTFMMACGNADEQQHLNTCDAAACINALIHHHSHVGTLLCLSRRIIVHLKKMLPTLPKDVPAYQSLWSFMWFRPSSIFSFSTQIVSKAEMTLEHRLHRKIEQFIADRRSAGQERALSAPDLQSLEKVCLLVEEWSHEMQSLSAAFVPICPIVTTLKPFSQQWHLSAATMTIWSLLVQLLPGQPYYLVRSRAAHQLEDVPCYLLHSFSTVLESDSKIRNYVRFSRNVRNFASYPSGTSNVIREIELLWDDIFFFGGALFSSSEAVMPNWWVGHVSFALALSFPVELVPLLRHITSDVDCMDDGRSEWLRLRLTQKLQREFEEREKKKETNDLLNPRDNIAFTENKARFSWWLSLLRTFLPLFRPRGVPLSISDDALPLSGVQVRIFLVADPEIKHYKILTFEQMTDLVRVARNQFDVCNLSPWQKHIAMI